MDARIWLKSGKYTQIDNLKEIKNVAPDLSAESVPFENLFIEDSFIYHFLGDITLVIQGERIDYIEFI